MSAIVGIHYLDGRPVDRNHLERMVEILTHRGPDGKGIWNKGSVGLGHRMLWTTPESLQEKLPMINKTGDFVITADARIDNRDELIAALKLNDDQPEEITDSQLILAAYEKWEKQCPEKLIGDFAFAIWDKRRHRFFCARDHLGVKPFYYYSSDQVFTFASEIKAILSLPEVPKRINEVRVAEYLASIFADASSTFYSKILRLPPAHFLIASKNKTELGHYWALDPAYEIRLSSDEKYASAFREVFSEAVECRLRSGFSTGSMLSGGLDSSSVTCVAGKLLEKRENNILNSFSGIFSRVTNCDERRVIDMVLAKYCIDPHYLLADEFGPLTDLDEILRFQDEPFYAPHLYMRWRLNQKAKNRAVRVLLDGFDCDTTVSHGLSYLNELAHEKHWLSLYTALKGLGDALPTSPTRCFLALLRRHGIHPIIQGLRTSHLKPNTWQILLREFFNGRGKCGNSSGWRVFIHPDLVRQTNLDQRYEAWWQAQPFSARNQRDEHYRDITKALKSFALEVLDKASAAFSVETRYPFWDKRLVEFCFALPPQQKVYRGWSRIALRRAMAGIIPEGIQWRRDKTDFYPNFLHGLTSFEKDRLHALILSEAENIKEFINILPLHEAYDRFLAQEYQKTSQDVEDAYLIWKAASLNSWLQNVKAM